MNEIDTSRVITWQYDKAETFLRLLEAREDVANMAAGEVWNRYYDNVFNLKTCNTFGLWTWGVVLGVSRPLVTENGVQRPISDEAFRRVLIARFYWMNANPSLKTASRYFSLLLNCGAGSDNPNRIVYIRDNYDMTCEIRLNWIPELEVMAVLQAPEIVNHPSGVLVKVKYPDNTQYLGFDGYWSSPSEASRNGLYATEINMWYYEDTGDKVVPQDPYYTADGTELEYDPSNVRYYLEEEGERVYYGEDASHPMYDSPNVSARHQLTLRSGFKFYYEKPYDTVRGQGQKVIVDTPYDNDGNALTQDYGGWYWTDTSQVKHYVLGQSLSNFDRSIFKPESI